MRNRIRRRIKKHSLIWVIKRSKHHFPVLCILALISMVSAYFSVRFALGTQAVIDAAVSGDVGNFKWAGIRLGILIMLIILINLLSRHLSDKLDVDMDRDMKKNMMHHILRGDYQALSVYHSGDLVHRLNKDADTVNSAIRILFTRVSSLAVEFIAVVTVLSGVSIKFTLFMIGLCVVLGGGTMFMQQMLKNLHKQINDASGKISGFLQEVIERLLIVQALDVGEAMEEKTDDLLEERWKLQRKRKNLGILTTAGFSILGEGIGFVALVWCARELLQGRMSFGMLTAITQLVYQLETPLFEVPYLLREVISMSASAERLMEIEAVPQEDKKFVLDIEKTYREMCGIAGDKLYFSYDRDFVLNGISFEIPKNKLTVIVGQSGSGKSTLLRILLSIYKPLKGSVCIVNDDGTKIHLSRDTRRLFTYAPQGNLLLSGTLRENLLLARPQATEEEIAQAVYISAIDDYLDQLPDGLDTYLGENASGISEGQAQRVALARAILSQAPILLLDEVTSALDPETERKVLARIRGLKNRTCIVVTHRPAILELADQIYSIVDGRIV